MKMVMIVYNEAIGDEVMDLLGKYGLKNYTKIGGAYGSGETSGTHMGNDIWPGKNNILYIACKDPEAKVIVSQVRELRKKLGQEGVKAFVMPIDEVT